MIERPAAALSARLRHVFDLLAQRLHLGGQSLNRLVGGDMVGHLAQRDDGPLELGNRRWVVLGDDEIDLVREVGDRVGISDQVFRRHQPLHRVANFGKAALDTAERGSVDAGLAAFGDAPVEALDLLFDSLEGAARHSVTERTADLAEFLAQGVDRLFDAGFAQRLDLHGDIAQLLFQARQVLTRHRPGRRRRNFRRGLRLPAPGRCLAAERTLARGDFVDGAVETRRQPHAGHFRRRGWRRAGGWGGLVAAAFRRVGCGARVREGRLGILQTIITPTVRRGELAGMKILVGEWRRWYARLYGLPDDHGVEPIVQRHAGPARGFFGGLERLRPDPFHS